MSFQINSKMKSQNLPIVTLSITSVVSAQTWDRHFSSTTTSQVGLFWIHKVTISEINSDDTKEERYTMETLLHTVHSTKSITNFHMVLTPVSSSSTDDNYYLQFCVQ